MSPGEGCPEPATRPAPGTARRPGIADVARGFQLFLGRELENVAVAGVHIASAPDLWDLVEAIWNSPEARHRRLAEALAVIRSAHAQDAPVTSASVQELDDLYRVTCDRWHRNGLGQRHKWLSRGELRFNERSVRSNLALALERGQAEWAGLLGMLERLGWRPESQPAVTVLGVEAFRLLGAGPQAASRLVAIELLEADVARGHRAEQLAQGRAERLLHLGEARGDLPEADLFYSLSALQYAPPPVILDMLRRCLGAVRPGGCAVFQLPASLYDYDFDVAAHLSAEDAGRADFHCVAQADILALLAGQGFRLLEVIPDERASIFGLSYTYVAAKTVLGNLPASGAGPAAALSDGDPGARAGTGPVETGPADIGSAEWLVQLLYHAVLGREADAQGLAHYANMIWDGYLDHRTLTSLLVGAPEYRQGAGAPSAFADHVERDVAGGSLLVPADPAAPGEGEPWALPAFLDHCRPGSVVLDLGAGRGLFSLPAAKRVEDGGCVYAVAPDPSDWRLLVHNIARNRLENVELLPIAPSPALDGSETRAPAASDRAPRVPLDLLLPFLRGVDVLRVDAANVEALALRGAIELIRRDRPVIFLEYAPRRADPRSGPQMARLLKVLGTIGYGTEILHRDQPRQLVDPDRAVETIEGAWKACARAGGTHLDLCLRPTR
ncbi:hypothetical protein PX554_20370 [Sphingomonas sp. H39-1-10]|uniref:DUF4214 domain-containing protein n=1 Tax=Sphingomonas pollutisoli TaxID=3030829 RepID=UPI0023B997D9|nr:DUF4214 domain-containing protein [Sphingomonas pollutisoli]MDF0490490.1 hypothetical protein [Sphingomonas pollutisoli]